ncbi:unnamed protein product [Lepidochelys kempii]
MDSSPAYDSRRGGGQPTWTGGGEGCVVSIGRGGGVSGLGAVLLWGDRETRGRCCRCAGREGAEAAADRCHIPLRACCHIVSTLPQPHSFMTTASRTKQLIDEARLEGREGEVERRWRSQRRR